MIDTGTVFANGTKTFAFYYDCKCCKAELKGPADVRKHYKRTHFKPQGKEGFRTFPVMKKISTPIKSMPIKKKKKTSLMNQKKRKPKVPMPVKTRSQKTNFVPKVGDLY